MIFALIPAAGKSTRMGQPKLALSLAGKTVLEHVIAALRRAQIEHILVVLGPHVSDLTPIARAAGAEVLLLAQETPDMRTTVEMGLRWLEDRFHPADQDSWLLIPADHPALSTSVVRALIQARQSDSRRSIVIPTFRSQRGHPALIGWNHVTAINSMSPSRGINVFLRQATSEVVEVPVELDDILLDLDTPEDYRSLIQRFS